MLWVDLIVQCLDLIKSFPQFEAISQNQISLGNNVVCTTHHIVHLMESGGANPD
jgi:hypothetical protein